MGEELNALYRKERMINGNIYTPCKEYEPIVPNNRELSNSAGFVALLVGLIISLHVSFAFYDQSGLVTAKEVVLAICMLAISIVGFREAKKTPTET